MKDELKAGQLITVQRGRLEGAVIILLDIEEHSKRLIRKYQIWNSIIVFSPCNWWGPGEKVSLYAEDLMKIS